MPREGERAKRPPGLRLPMLLLVACLAGGREATACPARCQCDLVHVPRVVRCADQGLLAFPENVSDFVEHLDLSGNLLTELPPDVNRLTELQHLNLARNNLSSLPASLRGLGNLRKLDLSLNFFRDAVADLGSLGQLTRLKSLYLQNNPLIELDGLRSPSLQFLNADACAIEKLKNTSLSGLPELTHLSLSSNPLKDIKDPYSLKLKGLDLSKCQLKVLSPRAFQGFPELIDLRLADNPTLVYSTRYETLRHQKLQKIDVSRCDLDRPGLHGLPALTYARLSSNSIRMLPDRIFAKNRELTHLFLDFNHLERLNKSSFANLIRLQVLDLSANGLKTVPSMAFRENIELQFLNLSENYLKEFPKLYTSVVSLDMSANLINRMEVYSIFNMPRVYHLNLSKNLIEAIPSGFNSSNLRSLILRKNRITTVENVSFSGLPELEKLDLSGNSISKGISPAIFFDNPNLRHLYLQDNPWHCDCSQLLPGYLYLTSLTTTPDSLVCHTPNNVTWYSWKTACANEWKSQPVHKSNNKTWGLFLASLLTIVVLAGTIFSIKHSMKIKMQARVQRQELERAEVRERLRLLQRRSIRLQEELREHTSVPRIHPLELVGPPSYEEAVTMQRLARSLDALDSASTDTRNTTIIRMTGSSESLRAGKKRRPKRGRRLRSQSEDNLSRREIRREERLRRIREPSEDAEERNDQPDDDDESKNKQNKSKSRPPTPIASKRNSRRFSARNGTSTDDEDSDAEENGIGGRRIGRTIIRNLDREPRSGYRPTTECDS